MPAKPFSGNFSTDLQIIRSLSIVIPVYNEEESLLELIPRTVSACEQTELPFEIILVDDGSSDRSAKLITDASRTPNSHVITVLLNRNYGQHAAIMAGFEQAHGDLVVTMDADLQNPPEEIPRLVQTATEGYDVVGTIRQNRQDSFFRKIASRMVNGMIRRAIGTAMTDYGCMLRAYRRPIVQAMLQCHERSTFVPLLANSFARRTTEILVMHSEREHGTSKYSLIHLINLMYDLVTCMTTTPLRLLSIVGSLIAGTGFAFALLLLLLRLFFGAGWSGDGVFTLFAILFIFIGAQFIGLGLLGEYIGRIYSDVRARPRYFIQTVVRPFDTDMIPPRTQETA